MANFSIHGVRHALLIGLEAPIDLEEGEFRTIPSETPTK